MQEDLEKLKAEVLCSCDFDVIFDEVEGFEKETGTEEIRVAPASATCINQVQYITLTARGKAKRIITYARRIRTGEGGVACPNQTPNTH